MVLRCDRRDVDPAKHRINYDRNKRIIITYRIRVRLRSAR